MTLTITINILIRPRKLVHYMFLEAAKASCKLKANKVKSRSLKDKRWFDKECSNKRKEVRKLANRKHRDPGNMHLRNEHNTLVKEFKKVCKVKESLFWKSKMEELTNKYYTNDFWDAWKSFDQNIQNKEPAPNVGNKWESHYRGLFNENRINSYDLDKLCSHLNNHKKSYCNTNLNHKITSKEIKKSIKKLKAKKQLVLTEFLMKCLSVHFHTWKR